MTAAPPTVLGLETEYGITGATSEEVVAACLEAAAAAGRSPGVRWDYSGEFPLRDARGFDMDPAAADPSMLTHRPGASVEGPVPGRVRTAAVVRLTRLEEEWQRGTATCLPDGGRLYVDHGHPEYATPECTSPAQAVRADRAGEALLTAGAARLGEAGVGVRLFKNNVDGKGATYGCHENYLVDRAIPFPDLVDALVPFLVTRQLLVGAGRVGHGVIADNARLQISQRADYFERVVGLGTTTDRPLVNTRDEPHADPQRWRRLHLICGDANCFDTSSWLKLGMTNLVLQVLHDGVPAAWRALALADPVAAVREVSHDVSLTTRVALAAGGEADPLTICQTYLDQARDFLDRHGLPAPAPTNPLEVDLEALAAGAGPAGAETGALLAFWQASLDALAAQRAGGPRATHLEWVAKHDLVTASAQRHPGAQGDVVAHAVDLAWSELGRGLAGLVPSGRAARERWRPATLAAALSEPPPTTRAWLRGQLLTRFPGQVVAAGWHSVLLETGARHHRRLPITDPLAWTRAEVESVVAAAPDVAHVLAALTDDDNLGKDKP
ncbi:proteasome accessory factor PafA2 family protein [Buchananella hordeovulneris]|uniref:proteasome accessory factor PafA2 family protein n=1 Tax=Buchananella hordeovulneris TaxID=52770 RepID=UPI001FEDE353|nr:proteasome accessory factor PafA2 family protein [Buchananella hordeovulneris]